MHRQAGTCVCVCEDRRVELDISILKDFKWYGRIKTGQYEKLEYSGTSYTEYIQNGS